MNENVILECQSLTKNTAILCLIQSGSDTGKRTDRRTFRSQRKRQDHTDQAHQRAAHADCRSGHDPTDGALSGNEKDRFLSS